MDTVDRKERMEAFREIFAPWEYDPVDDVRYLNAVTTLEEVVAILHDSAYAINSIGEEGIAHKQVSQHPIFSAENHARLFHEANWAAWIDQNDQEAFLLEIMKSVYVKYITSLLQSGLAETVEFCGSYDYFLEESVPMCILNEEGEKTRTCEARGFHLCLGVYRDANNPNFHIQYFTPSPKLLKFKIKVEDCEISPVKPKIEMIEDVQEKSQSFFNTFVFATHGLIEEDPPVRDISYDVDDDECCAEAEDILDLSTSAFNSKMCIGFARCQVCRHDDEDEIEEMRAEDLAKLRKHAIFAWNERIDQEELLHYILKSTYGEYVLALFRTGFFESAEISGSYDDVMEETCHMSILNRLGRRCHPADESYARGFHLYLGFHQNPENLENQLHVKFLTPYPYRRDLTIIVGDWKISPPKYPHFDDNDDSNHENEADDFDEPISPCADVYNVPSLQDITAEAGAEE